MFQNNAGIVGGGIDPTTQQATGFNGSPILQQQQPQQQQQQQPQQLSSSTKNIRRKAYVKITEQPAGKALRFRYECEGRSAGSIPGVNSTPENKTFPTIEIVGYKGRAVVVVSCVTKDPPHRPHPHNLVGKEGCKKGVCTLEINSETMRAVFSNLGIQCVKKKDIESALRAREEIRVDPFKTGFTHRFQPSSIDLNSVRLCFQVFLESEQKGRFTVPLPPVVSDPIFDKKAMSDLVICTLCSCSSTVAGGKEIILLCEKVAKEDISVRFYEEHNGHVVWEGFGDFQHTDVHKQTAIKFKTPRYRTLEIDQPAKVFIQLRRPSDGATSEPLPFDFLPLDSDPAVLKRKRQKTGGDPNLHLLRQFQTQDFQNQPQLNDQQDSRTPQTMNYLNVGQNSAIKTEPRDTSPLPYNMYGNAYRLPEQSSPSPQPLSPTNPYNNQSNTPSPFSLATGGNGGANNNLISPNHNQFGAGSMSPNMNMDMTNYGAAYQQQQYAQQNAGGMNVFAQQQAQQQWGGGPADMKTNQTMQNINNLNSTNFNVNNLLTTATSANAQQQHDQWHPPPTMDNHSRMSAHSNLPPANTFNVNMNQMLGNTQHQHGSNNNGDSMNLGGGVGSGDGPTLSGLLNTIDSEQLMHLNSAELSGLSLS